MYNNRAVIAALIYGTIPYGPTLALQIARRVRTLLKLSSLSEDLRSDWVALEEQLTLRAEDRSADMSENAETTKKTEEVESEGTPGIYVYTLRHYLKYPVEPRTGRTYLKVGHSAYDALHSSKTQARLTALPESCFAASVPS